MEHSQPLGMVGDVATSAGQGAQNRTHVMGAVDDRDPFGRLIRSVEHLLEAFDEKVVAASRIAASRPATSGFQLRTSAWLG
jgi:hypothetical protein